MQEESSISAILDKISSDKNKSDSDLLTEHMQGSIDAGLIGAGVGFVIGYYREYNLLTSSIIGFIIMGTLGSFLIKRQQKKAINV